MLKMCGSNLRQILKTYVNIFASQTYVVVGQDVLDHPTNHN